MLTSKDKFDDIPFFLLRRKKFRAFLALKISFFQVFFVLVIFAGVGVIAADQLKVFEQSTYIGIFGILLQDVSLSTYQVTN